MKWVVWCGNLQAHLTSTILGPHSKPIHARSATFTIQTLQYSIHPYFALYLLIHAPLI